MKFELNRVTIKNFASVTNRITLDVSEMGTGLHFIRGRNEANKRLGANGVGKSTLFAALCWALYGRTPDGLRNTDIEPWHGDKKTTVKVVFTLDDKDCVVVRTTHPNRLTFNDKDISQEYIDRRLLMNFTTFTNSVLAGQDRELFLDRSPSDKLILFSEVLDLDRWKVRSKLAADTVSNLSTEIDVLENLVKSHKKELADITTAASELKRKSEGFDAEVAQKIEARRKELKSETRRLNELKPRYEDAQLELEKSMEIKSIQDLLTETQTAYRNAEKTKIEFDVKIGHAIRDRNTKTLALQELEIAKVCPTCKQRVGKNETAKQRKELQRQIQQLTKIIRNGPPPRTLEIIEDCKAKIASTTKKLEKVQKEVDKAQSEVAILAPDVAQAQQRVYALTQELEELRTKENPYFEQYADARRSMKKKAALLDDETKDLRLKRRRRERTKFWIKGFKDIRLMIVNETLREIELATNALLEEFGLIGWEVLYDVEKETKAGTIKRGLSVSILSPYNDKPVKWEAWSGGEKQRLRLLGTFALSDVLLNRAGIEPSFEIFDEQSKFLSKEGVSDLVEMLADRATRTNKTIFLVDHTTIESSRFASTTTIIRSKDGTSVTHD